MATKPFSKALDDLESLLDSSSKLSHELGGLVGDGINKLIGNEIGGLLKTRDFKTYSDSTPNILQRLIVARTRLGSHHLQYQGIGLDLLIQYTVHDLRASSETPPRCRPSTPSSWLVPVVSCELRSDAAEKPVQYGLWLDRHYPLPIMFEWEADTKTFHVFSGHTSIYRTAKDQGPPLVVISISFDYSTTDLEMRMALRPIGIQKYNESFDLEVASYNHLYVLAGYFYAMGCYVCPKQGGQ